jgi:hypothetical protein
VASQALINMSRTHLVLLTLLALLFVVITFSTGESLGSLSTAADRSSMSIFLGALVVSWLASTLLH